MKYFVIITRWSDEKKAPVKEIAGTFDKFFNASLFAMAYREHFKSEANIVEASDVIEAFYN